MGEGLEMEGHMVQYEKFGQLDWSAARPNPNVGIQSGIMGLFGLY